MAVITQPVLSNKEFFFFRTIGLLKCLQGSFGGSVCVGGVIVVLLNGFF